VHFFPDYCRYGAGVLRCPHRQVGWLDGSGTENPKETSQAGQSVQAVHTLHIERLVSTRGRSRAARMQRDPHFRPLDTGVVRRQPASQPASYIAIVAELTCRAKAR